MFSALVAFCLSVNVTLSPLAHVCNKWMLREHHRKLKVSFWKYLLSVIVQGLFSSLLQIAAAENFKGLFNLQHFYTVLALRRGGKKEGRKTGRNSKHYATRAHGLFCIMLAVEQSI